MDAIRQSAKAIAALVVGALMTYLVTHGVHLDRTIVEPLAVGLVTAIIVWFTRNKAKTA